MIRGLIIALLLIGGGLQAQISDFGKIDFSKADSIADLYHKEDLKSLPLLSQKLTDSLTTDIEKFRAIYTWVCKNITNDHAAYLRNRKNREKLQGNEEALENWNRTFSKKVFAKLLKEQKTVCTGYAYLVRELSGYAGIECKIIDGYGRTGLTNIEDLSIPNHSWNAVWLNDKWYLCDATWSSGTFMIPSYEFKAEYNDGYFLADPVLFARNHYPLEDKWLLLESSFTIDEFLNGPVVYEYAFNHQINPISPQKLNLNHPKNEPIHFYFKAPETLRLLDIDIELAYGDNTREVKPEVDYTDDGLVDLSYTFERQGRFDIHIRVNKEIVATYSVRVKKK